MRSGFRSSQYTMQLSIGLFSLVTIVRNVTAINFVENDSRGRITSWLKSVTVPMTFAVRGGDRVAAFGILPPPAVAFGGGQRELFTDATSLPDNSISGSGLSMKEENYWLGTTAIPRSDPSRALPASVDVAVIGSGVTGLSAARVLGKRGVRTAVLEAKTFGWGASSRNGGMVLTGMKLPVPTLISRYGRERVRRMYAASLASIDCVEQIVREESIECDFGRCGHLEVACKPAHFDGYAKSAELVEKEFNHTLRIVPKASLREEIGSDIYHGGLVDELSAGLNPARYVCGLATAAERAGAAMFDHTPVTGVERISQHDKCFRVSTLKGSLTARELLIATGAYTTDATPALQRKIIPIGPYIIASEVLSDSVAHELSPKNRMIYDSKHFLYYYRLAPDRRMLFGGRAAFFPESENTVRESAEILRRGMIQVFPLLQNVKVEFVWGGTLDFAFDVMPHTGRSAGMYYAVGYAGHGVAIGTYLGTKIAGVICGEPNDIPFDGIPFPTPPFGLRSGHTWALPLAGAYYKFLDWIS
jgi:glycine/D-amino acid oxidase-like deaminating enzyme